MKLLAEITDATIGIGEAEKLGESYRLRKSARAVLLNDEGLMAVQHLSVPQYHKLPGGGVEVGESVEEALTREIQEEVGCACEITKPLGVVIEYRNIHDLIHISYGFEAKVVGEVGEAAHEPEEEAEGQTNLWLAPEELASRLKTDTPKTDRGLFQVAREQVFLAEYLTNHE